MFLILEIHYSNQVSLSIMELTSTLFIQFITISNYLLVCTTQDNTCIIT